MASSLIPPTTAAALSSATPLNPPRCRNKDEDSTTELSAGCDAQIDLSSVHNRMQEAQESPKLGLIDVHGCEDDNIMCTQPPCTQPPPASPAVLDTSSSPHLDEMLHRQPTLNAESPRLLNGPLTQADTCDPQSYAFSASDSLELEVASRWEPSEAKTNVSDCSSLRSSPKRPRHSCSSHAAASSGSQNWPLREDGSSTTMKSPNRPITTGELSCDNENGQGAMESASVAIAGEGVMCSNYYGRCGDFHYEQRYIQTLLSDDYQGNVEDEFQLDHLNVLDIAVHLIGKRIPSF